MKKKQVRQGLIIAGLVAVLVGVGIVIWLTIAQANKGKTRSISESSTLTNHHLQSSTTASSTQPVVVPIPLPSVTAQALTSYTKIGDYQFPEGQAIKNKQQLEQALSQEGRVVLSGIYRLDGGFVRLKSHQQIDAHQAIFVGSLNIIAAFCADSSWQGGVFIRGYDRMSSVKFALWRSERLTFEDMVFLHGTIGSHMFDVMGSDHIKLANNLYIGYDSRANSFSSLQNSDFASKKGQINTHDIYAESIQVDRATAKGAGKTIADYLAKNYSAQYRSDDGEMTRYLTIENSKWQPYNEPGKPYEGAQNPFGQHGESPGISGEHIYLKGNSWSEQDVVDLASVKWQAATFKGVLDVVVAP